jgi:hypothetical protein
MKENILIILWNKFTKYGISLNVGALSWNVIVISSMSNIAVILNLVLKTFLCKFEFYYTCTSLVVYS